MNQSNQSMESLLCPYDEAYELKELGFDEPCGSYYDNKKELRRSLLEYPIINSKNGFHEKYGIVTTPTYFQAFRWFRERHQLPSWVYTSNNQEYWYSVLKDGRMIVRDYKPFKSYEDAELACLRKLIEIVKNK